MDFLKIGEVAKQSNVGIETIRYYERVGLLAKPERRPSGYRQYDQSVVARLKFIRRTKELGFTLAEIRELLALWFDANTRCEHIRERAKLKITEIEDKILSLRKMKRSLKKVVSECESQDALGECPLLEGLDH
jgi:MerR family copper efflux transcriptional regulator